MLSRAASIAIVALATVAGATSPPTGWTTYRSERFGYALSYPSGTELRVYFEGESGDLRDRATGESLLALEVWPPDLCPHEAAGTTARALGTERAATATQADGDDGSSSCGRPIAVREWRSPHDVAAYELALACRGEHRIGHHLVRERYGKKGPTFFADISQPWRTRVLMLDPAGIDPRLGSARGPDPAIVRQIVDTLVTFPVPDPHVVCIEDLRPAVSAAVASPPAPAPR